MTRPPSSQRPFQRKPASPKQSHQNREEKKISRKMIWLKRLTVIFLAGFVFSCLLVSGVVFYFSRNLPGIAYLKTYQPPVITQIYASNFEPLADFAGENRIFVPYAQIPAVVRDAFISAEDKDFWTEPGFDPLAIIRAAFTDIFLLAEHRRPYGASTITQQLAKNMLLNDRLSIRRKIRELILAWKIDHTLSKQRVLELYLNEIYLGQGAYGISAASRVYFDKPIGKVTLAEAATLASLPKAPSYFDPFVHPAAILARRNWVLYRMTVDGWISKTQEEAALKAPLLPKRSLVEQRLKKDVIPESGYFSDVVNNQLLARFGRTMTDEGGLEVRTSLNPVLQTAAVQALRAGLIHYDHVHGGWRGPLGHLDTTGDFSRLWPARLAALPLPAGIIPAWRQAVVLWAGPSLAKLGWLNPTDIINGLSPAESKETGYMRLSGMKWAGPPAGDGFVGPLPTAVNQVLAKGDVVLIKPLSSLSPNEPPLTELEQVPKVEGALVALDPKTGAVLAMVGGWSYKLSQFNRATQAERQPGSSFKPVDYLTAMEENIAPDAMILDAPFVINFGNGKIYRPGNYENMFHGPVTVHYALQQSLNLATLHLSKEVGLAKIARTAEEFGVVPYMPLIYPAVIGALDTTVMHMAAFYASLDDGGQKVTPSYIDYVINRNGQVVYQNPNVSCPNCEGPTASPDILPQLIQNGPQLADPQSVFQMVQMMQGVVTRGTGVFARIGLADRQIAGKTGTTQAWHDAWFIGFTPDLVTAVWVGFDQPKSLGGYQTAGGWISAPIWNQFMRRALANRPVLDFVPPQGIRLAYTTAGNVPPIIEAFKPGQIPNYAFNHPSPLEMMDGASPVSVPGVIGLVPEAGGLNNPGGFSFTGPMTVQVTPPTGSSTPASPSQAAPVLQTSQALQAPQKEAETPPVAQKRPFAPPVRSSAQVHSPVQVQAGNNAPLSEQALEALLAKRQASLQKASRVSPPAFNPLPAVSVPKALKKPVKKSLPPLPLSAGAKAPDKLQVKPEAKPLPDLSAALVAPENRSDLVLGPVASQNLPAVKNQNNNGGDGLFAGSYGQSLPAPQPYQGP